MKSVQSVIRKIAKEEWLYNPREHPFSYSVFYSSIAGKFLFYKRSFWKMSDKDILLCKEGALIVCSILNKQKENDKYGND